MSEQPIETETDVWLGATDAARHLGVSTATLIRWDGTDPLLTSVRTPGGHRRWRRSNLEAFIGSQQAAQR